MAIFAKRSPDRDRTPILGNPSPWPNRRTGGACSHEFKELLVSASKPRTTRDTNPLPHDSLLHATRTGAKGRGTQGMVMTRRRAAQSAAGSLILAGLEFPNRGRFFEQGSR